MHNSYKFVIFLIISSFFLLNNKVYSSAQNQAPRFDPPLHSNYFFPEFNATKPGNYNLKKNL